MNAEFYSTQVATLIDMVEQGQGDQADDMAVLAAQDFLDEDKLAAEKAMFRRLPLLVGHSSEIADAGDFVVREFDSRSWLIVRGDDGVARAFLNYCQHRGTKLEQSSAGCKRRFSCPYHAWTYGVKGNLVGVPRPDLFPGMDKSSKSLKAGHLQEAFGLLWLTQEGDAKDVAEYLGPDLVAEFEAQNFAEQHVFFDKTRTLNANWKFPIFAFLESYHIGTLHKNSIAEFFIENVAHSEQHGPHLRSFVPRKKVTELKDADLSQINLPEYITPTNILFPNLCMIGHPTSYTFISMFPGKTPGTSEWRHMLLTPKEPQTEAELGHYRKTVEVLDGMTYEKEDFWVSEQLQEGINAGAIDELVLATNEELLKHFNDMVEKYAADS